jgi:hypothetical protein
MWAAVQSKIARRCSRAPLRFDAAEKRLVRARAGDDGGG